MNNKYSLGLHPAIRKLAWSQTWSRLERIGQQLKNPRRLVLTILAGFLAIVWVGQAILSIFLRDPTDPADLARYICLSLVGYAIWNSVKVCLRNPVEAFEWTESERELLLASPLPRRELIKYRLASLVASAGLKSAIFTIVMIPDLAILPLGFLGMLSGLLIIDILRLGLEVLVWGLNPSQQKVLRVAMISFLFAVVSAALGWAAANSDVMKELSTAGSLGFLIQLVKGLGLQVDSYWGRIIGYPFLEATKVVLATSFSLATAVRLFALAGAIAMGFAGLIQMDAWMVERRIRFAKTSFANLRKSGKLQSKKQKMSMLGQRRKLDRPSCGGIIPLAARQLQGAWFYRKQMLFALGVPFVFCCLPAFSDVQGLALIGNVVAAMVFYSFLLLPTSCKFDFRRDVDRLKLLKSLPVAPLNVAIGQVSGPVIITLLFQAAVLVAACLLNSGFSILYVPITLALMVPLNALIFGFENLVFMYYPHRLNQEGIHVFVRTVLTFTAKGLVFAIGLAAVIFWFFMSQFLAGVFRSDYLPTSLIFGCGIVVALTASAILVIRLLANAFAKFDPTVDLAGLD